jgi:hypothetical protein
MKVRRNDVRSFLCSRSARPEKVKPQARPRITMCSSLGIDIGNDVSHQS